MYSNPVVHHRNVGQRSVYQLATRRHSKELVWPQLSTEAVNNAGLNLYTRQVKEVIASLIMPESLSH
jgi:hypothetical protein